ncbi:topless-related protein [Trifolium repens]|nr:topless-related protein [Trifolium repens]
MMLLVFQFLQEENMKETLQKMEQEFGLFLNLNPDRKCIIKCGFSQYHIAVSAISKTTKPRRRSRLENEYLSHFGDARSTRVMMLSELKKLININPNLNDKLKLPSLNESQTSN